MHMKKIGPNNRLIKKEKNQTISSTNFKGGTHRKPTSFVIKPQVFIYYFSKCDILVPHNSSQKITSINDIFSCYTCSCATSYIVNIIKFIN